MKSESFEIHCNITVEFEYSSRYLVVHQKLEQSRVIDAFLISIGHDIVFDDDNLLE